MGSFSILNNISGINAQNQLTSNNVMLTRTLLRLSSGKRINTGADDAAGLQIADSLRANIRALDQAVRNANDGISVSQIADGALGEMSSLLFRSVTLAEEAATGTIDSVGRSSLNNEFRQIEAEIARIAIQTNFNGMGMFGNNGAADFNSTLNIFVGDVGAGRSSISVTLGQITASPGSVGSIGGASLATVDLTTATGAASALKVINQALAGVSSSRASIGSGINRLQSAVAVIQAQSQNTQSAESTIRDANVAEEVANLTKYQILAQSGIAALTQANSNSELAIGLLRK